MLLYSKYNYENDITNRHLRDIQIENSRFQPNFEQKQFIRHFLKDPITTNNDEIL